MRIVRKNSRIYSTDVRNVMASRIGFFFLLATLTLAGRVTPPIEDPIGQISRGHVIDSVTIGLIKRQSLSEPNKLWVSKAK